MKAQRFYFISADSTDGNGMIVVAHTAREAKKLYWRHNELDIEQFIDLKVEWKKPDRPIPKELPIGRLKNDWIGLFYGMYGWIYEDCPFCHASKQFDLDGLDTKPESQCVCPACLTEIKEMDVIHWEAIL
jgi:hypothetical protein